MISFAIIRTPSSDVPSNPDHGTVTVIWPGWTIEMTPPQVHMHLELLLRAGIFLRRTLGEPGAQGLDVTGTQGAGVGVPNAAAVAAATAGFVWVMHMVKGMIFTTGI
jgi:hypothetical protein